MWAYKIYCDEGIEIYGKKQLIEFADKLIEDDRETFSKEHLEDCFDTDKRVNKILKTVKKFNNCDRITMNDINIILDIKNCDIEKVWIE